MAQHKSNEKMAEGFWGDTPAPAKAAVAPPTVPVGAVTDAQYEDVGKRLLNKTLIGVGTGAGATGLYYFMQHLRRQQKRRAEEQEAQKELGLSKFADLADIQRNIYRAAGKAINVPGQMLSSLAGNAEGLLPHAPGHKDMSYMQGGTDRALGVLGPAVGALAGNAMMRHFVESRKRKQRAADVMAAKQEYLDALTGTKSASLDAAYEKMASWATRAHSALAELVRAGAENTVALGLIGGVGLGGVGANYMYNRTKNLAAGNNTEKARKLQRRLQTLPTQWVDPQELENVKLLSQRSATE